MIDNKHRLKSILRPILKPRQGLPLSALMVVLCFVFFSNVSFAQSVLFQKIKSRGSVVCGVNTDLKGISSANSLGEYSGLEPDFCRAVASAIFNDPAAVDFKPVTSKTGLQALTSRSIDLLAQSKIGMPSRARANIEFVGISYHDGQGFMVPKRSGVRSALELDSQSVCIRNNFATEQSTDEFFNISNMQYQPRVFDTDAKMIAAYAEGKCVAITNELTTLGAIRATLDRPDAHTVLPEVISKQPLGPAVRYGDTAWSNIVRWTLNCMINAEEIGINSDNVDQLTLSSNSAIARLLGTTGNFGGALGLDNAWCANVITHIGNYAQMHERNVGANTKLGLVRGVNALWTNGGLLYAPPIR